MLQNNLKLTGRSTKTALVKSLTQAVLVSTLFMMPCVQADTIISAPTVATLLTSVAGNITVLTTGQVAPAAGDAIIVDAATAIPAVITLVSGNTVPNSAIFSATGNGVNIQMGAAGAATVNVGSNTAITGFTSGVLIDNLGATITNNGSILAAAGGNNAIFITVNGLSPTITNTAGALIQGSNSHSITDDPNGPGSQLVLSNSGTISVSQANLDAIQLNTTFAAITNNSGGIIQNNIAGFGNAIAISGVSALTGTINNSGLISVGANGGSGIFINNNFTGGNINNNSGGIIQATSTGAGISINNNFGLINNSGTIRATANFGIPIQVIGNSNGIINNFGLISAVNQPGILINADIAAINSSGNIITNSASGAIDAGAVTIASGIINSGNILNLGGPAVNLIAATNANFTQNGGLVTGDVNLAGHDGSGITGDVFNMTGGIILGDITAANVVPNTLVLEGGVINGSVFLGNMGDTLELAGTDAQALIGGTGADTFNMSGGSFTSLDGNGGADVMNVTGSFTAGSIANVPTMNLIAGTFTANGPISGLDTALNIAAPATLIVNNTVNGTADILNNGRLTINGNVNIPAGDTLNNNRLEVNSGGILTTNQYIQTAAGNFIVDVNGLNPLGAIQTTAGNVTIGGLISPTFSAGTFVPSGTTYDIIKTLGGTITDTSTVLPASLVISFTKDVVIPCGAGECIQLTSFRIPFTSLPIPPSTVGVAGVLDILSMGNPATLNPDILNLLGQLDIITNQQVLNSALASLTPQVNYALPMSSRIIMNSSFNSVLRRLKDLTGLRQLGYEDYNAYRRMDKNAVIFVDSGENFGDQTTVTCGTEGCFYRVLPGRIRRNQIGLWAEGFGAVIDQAIRDQVEGYHAEAGGAMIGFDAGDLGRATVGGAISWVNIHSVSRNDTHTVLDTIGYQGTFYGWFSPYDGYFVDTLLGFATQKYRQRRNININDVIVQTAHSKFYGINLAAQMDVGYAFLYKAAIVAPTIRARYSRLSVDNYTEVGLGGLDLAVKSSGYNEFVLGAGVRVGGKFNLYDAIYSPEFSVLVLNDFYNTPEAYTASFIGGGGPFLTQGRAPGSVFSLWGLGITAETPDGYTATLRYELEVRDHFYGNSGYFQLRYEWG